MKNLDGTLFSVLQETESTVQKIFDISQRCMQPKMMSLAELWQITTLTGYEPKLLR